MPPLTSPLFRNATGLPRSDFGIFTVLTFFSTSARLTLPSAQDFEIAIASAWTATHDGAPKLIVLPNRRVNAATIDLSAGTLVTSRLNDETNAPGNLNCDESNVPSVPMNLPRKPAAFSCSLKSCAFDATCVANMTPFAPSATAFCASEVKSVWVAGCDCRSTLTPAFRKSELASEISGTEYASAESTVMTVLPFLMPCFFIRNFTSTAAWKLSFGTTRKKCPAIPFPSAELATVRLARVAEPETKAKPAFERIGPPATFSWLPEKPLTPISDESDLYFVATVAATCGLSCVSSSTVVRWTRFIPFGTPGMAFFPFQ